MANPIAKVSMTMGPGLPDGFALPPEAVRMLEDPAPPPPAPRRFHDNSVTTREELIADCLALQEEYRNLLLDSEAMSLVQRKSKILFHNSGARQIAVNELIVEVEQEMDLNGIRKL
jgi:hypothetical protein